MKADVTQLPEHEKGRIVAAMESACPRVLPATWRSTEAYPNAAWFLSRDGLKVCLEVELQDGELWLHASMSRRDRIPSYIDQRLVKALFVGRDRKAIQVFPAEAEHFNHMPHCLHLFSPLERDPLPDFRREDGGL